MAATIQTIETPKRWRAQDTSGNNNHGQIYSGRALEFDGVTDYLTVPDSSSYKLTDNVTVSFWSNMTTNDGWDSVFGHSSGFSNGLWLAFDAAGQLNCQLEGVVAHASFGSTVNAQENTWYRCVMTYSSSSGGVLYMNGQSVGTCSAAGAITQPSGAYQIGFTDTEYYFEGWLSDLQVWDSVWTADDVAFDYANPEQLALNKGGTSLTESNLKLWYPMNDGHRGQQSYVLDASNTGLGDVTSSLTSWSTGTDVFETLTSSGLDVTSAINSSGNGRMITNSGIVCAVGDIFKITFDVTFNGGQIQGPKLKTAVDGTDLTTTLGYITGSDSYTYYLNCIAAGTGGLFFYSNDTSTDFSMNNIKVYRVNNKNHATTVFYGDELNTQANAVTPEHSSASEANDAANWTNVGMAAGTFGSSTDNETQGTYSLRMVVNSNGDYAHTNFTTTIVGRTYRMQWDRRITNHDADSKVDFKVGTSAEDSTNGILNSFTSDDATTSVVGEYIDFVATATTTFFTIRESGDGNDADLYLDNLSLREIGTATGWTDADQQLDIPQTALQSYNQLAWFSGTNGNYVALDSDIDTGSNSWSFSFWIFNKDSGQSFDFILGKNTSLNLTLDNNSDRKLYYRDADTDYNALSDEVIPQGEWVHIVVTATGDTSMLAYINGEAQTSITSMQDSGAADTQLIVNRFMAGYSVSEYESLGCITEISYYNDVLTQAEVNDLYNDGKAKDADEASGNGNLVGYWRNNGLAEWKDRKGSNDANTNSVTETILQQAGVDASRDCQGFLMNRQKDTNALNIYHDNTTDINQGVLTKGAESPLTEAQLEEFSISMWVKVFDKDIANDPLINITIDDAAHFTTSYHSDEDIYFTYEIGGTAVRYQTNTYNLLTQNEWSHVVFVCKYAEGTDTDKVKIYINGKFRTSTAAGQTTSTTSPSNNNSMWIGCESIKGTKFNGMIDDVLIYTGTLSDGLTSPSDGDTAKEEVKRNYNAGKRSHR